MPRTEVRSGQILNATVARVDLNTTTPGEAVVAKIVAGTGITISSTGADTGTGDVTIHTSGGGGIPGGSDTQIQFNDGGIFGGDTGLTYNKTTDVLTLTGQLTAGGLNGTPLNATNLTSGTVNDVLLSVNVLKHTGGFPGGTTNYLRADGTFAATPAAIPGGSNTQVQFNDGGVFGGNSGLTLNKVTGDVTVNIANISNASFRVYHSQSVNAALQIDTTGKFILRPTAVAADQGMMMDTAGMPNGSNAIFVNVPAGWTGNILKANLNNIETFNIAQNGYAVFSGLTVQTNLLVNGMITVPGSTSHSSIRAGALELQSYGVNNNWLADNLYFDGASFRYQSAGSAGQIYFEGNNINFYTSPVGSAQDTAIRNVRMEIMNSGQTKISSQELVVLRLTANHSSGGYVAFATGSTVRGYWGTSPLVIGAGTIADTALESEGAMTLYSAGGDLALKAPSNTIILTAPSVSISSSLSVNNNISLGGNITTAQYSTINSNGTASDNTYLYMCGGGAPGASRGSCLVLFGYGYAGGGAQLLLSNHSSSSFQVMRGDNTMAFYVEGTTGRTVHQTTNGANAWTFNSLASNGGLIEIMRSGNYIGRIGNATILGFAGDNNDLAVYASQAGAKLYLETASGSIRSQTAYNDATGTGTANCVIESDGRWRRVTSSRKYKTNIESLSDWKWLLDLNPVQFDPTDHVGERCYGGLIAEEVAEVSPKKYGKPLFAELGADDEPTNVMYGALIAPMLLAIKELTVRVKELESRTWQ